MTETPANTFSCEICVIFKKILFIEHLWVTASAPCKDLVILQILANFNKSLFIFPFLYLLPCNPSFAILASL